MTDTSPSCRSPSYALRAHDKLRVRFGEEVTGITSMTSETETPQPAPMSTREKVLTPVHFFLRGLAISLPTILTVVILLWILRGVNTYIIYPSTSAVKWVLAEYLDESVPTDVLVRLPSRPDLEECGRNYLATEKLRLEWVTELEKAKSAPVDSERLTVLPKRDDPLWEQAAVDWLESREKQLYVPMGDRAVPYDHYRVVARELPNNEMPQSSTGLYMEYAAEQYFGWSFQLSAVAVVGVIFLLYFIGRLVTARLGHWIVTKVETGILGKLPVIRNVYGSVKQVTDFLFSESQVEYRRVVAIEYPRQGIWSLGLVTGDSMLDIATAVGEPCVTVLIPSSPMPVTGYTMSIPRSQLLDLNISVDQAMQFCVSCGVLVPPEQKVTPQLLREHLAKRFDDEFDGGPDQPQRPAIPHTDTTGDSPTPDSSNRGE